MTRRLVIGVGNPDRGDDGAGREVARRLARAPQRRASRCASARGEATALMDAWPALDDVVLVDACRGAGPGAASTASGPTTRCASRGSRHASTHSLGVAAAVGLARALGRCRSASSIYAIEAAPLGEG